MNIKKIFVFLFLALSLICVSKLFLEESNMFGRGLGRRLRAFRRCEVASFGRGDGSGRREGYGRFQDGSGPQSNSENCQVFRKSLGRNFGRGDGSGRREGYGRFQDGSGPQGGTNNCPRG